MSQNELAFLHPGIQHGAHFRKFLVLLVKCNFLSVKTWTLCTGAMYLCPFLNLCNFRWPVAESLSFKVMTLHWCCSFHPIFIKLFPTLFNTGPSSFLFHFLFGATSLYTTSIQQCSNWIPHIMFYIFTSNHVFSHRCLDVRISTFKHYSIFFFFEPLKLHC